MSDLTPTPEQESIYSAALSSKSNILISALAGAAKTTTLVGIAERVPIPSLFLAFNKRIAVEMKERLPAHCVAKTLNGLGHSSWGKAMGKRLELRTSKTYDLVQELIKPLAQEDRNHIYSTLSDVLHAIDGGKTAGYIPSNHFPDCRGLMDDDELYEWMDEQPTDLQWDIIREVSTKSITLAFQGIIDFNDQLLLPTTFRGAVFDSYPLVCVDEVQDLSALNHAMLRKVVRGSRLIAVGDACQSIYGFRGAHQDSMSLLREQFSMQEFFLTTSFRCPRAVVEAARWRAPAMQYPEWAKEGKVSTLHQWTEASIPDGAAIICRNNAPLFSLALKLLAARRYPEILGNDVGKGLLKIMKKFGPLSLSQDAVLSSIEAWTAEKLTKSRSPNSIHDRATCMRVFATEAKDLGGAIAFAEHIFNSSGPIKLMTGHRSKGLEFDHVFILDRKLIRMDEQQDKNLFYVAQTRAKETLTYINLEGYIS